MLDGHPTKFAPGERFSYCNGGYVVLALIAERASGSPSTTSCGSASARRRGCSTPSSSAPTSSPAVPRSATSPIDGAWRTNVFHLPVRGSGDGGIYSTVADISAFWRAFLAGADRARRAGCARWCGRAATCPGEALRPRLLAPRSTDAVMLIGSDAGVSFRTVHDPAHGVTYTVSRTRPTAPGRSPGTSRATRHGLSPRRSPGPVRVRGTHRSVPASASTPARSVRVSVPRRLNGELDPLRRLSAAPDPGADAVDEQERRSRRPLVAALHREP